MPSSEAVWRSGRYNLDTYAESIDGIQKCFRSCQDQGKAESILNSDWKTLPSSGVAEDEFMVKLVEAVTGKTVNDLQEP